LAEPIKPAEPVMTATAREPGTTGSVALAMTETESAVPLPVPSPYASAQSGKPGGMFSWLTGDNRKPDEATEETPKADAETATPPAKIAATRSKPAKSPPVAASMGGAEEKSPFYKRWFSGAKTDDEKVAARKAAPAPRAATAPAVVPAPAPRPQQVETETPAAAQPAPADAPQPETAAERGPPNLPPISPDALGASPILSSG